MYGDISLRAGLQRSYQECAQADQLSPSAQEIASHAENGDAVAIALTLQRPSCPRACQRHKHHYPDVIVLGGGTNIVSIPGQSFGPIFFSTM